MITCFPELHRDELLYSGCARYAERMRYRSKAFAVKDLFGDRAKSVDVFFPRHLERFVNGLAPGSAITLDAIIECHTMIPLYRPFQRLDWDGRAQKYVVGSADRPRHPMPAKSFTLENRYIRYCPACTQGDLKRYGERFWHRLHQAPGCLVCLEHQVFLEHTSIPVRSRLAQQLFSADEVLKPCRPRPINRRLHKILMRLAEDMQWVLEHAGEIPRQPDLRARYAQALNEQRLMTYRGKMYRDRFRTRWEQFCPTELQRQLGKPAEIVAARWFFPGHVNDIVEHLLVAQMLGLSMSELVAVEVKCDEIPSRSWTCHNRAADHYGRLMPMKADLVYVGCRKKVRLSCSCGFVYEQLLDPPRPRSRPRIHVIQYGERWDGRLRRLWDNPSLTLVQIINTLDICWDRFTREVRRLKLPDPRTIVGHSPMPLLSLRHERQTSLRELTLAEHRQEFVKARQQYPRENRSFFYKRFPRTTAFLSKHDRAWLDRYLPLAAKRRTKVRDWPSLDSAFESAMRRAAAEIQARPGRPMRISRNRLLRAAQLSSASSTAVAQLPRTRHALVALVETEEQCTRRRIRWAMRQPESTEAGVKEWVLLKVAGVKRIAQRNPEIAAAVQQALDELRNT